MRFGAAKSVSASSVPHSLPAFYEWRIPGQMFSIHLSYDLIDRLQTDVMKGFWAVPKRGAEVGGLLLGRVVASSSLTNGETTLFIEDYEAVACEHRRGPSYVLSESDRKRLERALRRGGREKPVVGYYRSHTRPGLYLDEDDMAVVRSYFSNPTDVVLLIRPSASRSSVAGFFFWEEEDIRRHSTYREFAFSREELQKPLLPEPRAESASAPAVTEAAEPARTAALVAMRSPEAAPRVPAAGWSWTRWKPLPYAAALLVGLGLMEYQILGLVRSRSGERSGERPAALRVERNGDYLQVSWDRESARVSAARSGVLTITDGRYTRQLELDAAHLRNGSIAYAPSGNDVSFKLELHSAGKNFTESVRVVTAPPAESADAVRGSASRLVAVNAPAPKTAPKVALPARREPAPQPAQQARPARPKYRFHDDGL